jgi:hypothetical protein
VAWQARNRALPGASAARSNMAYPSSTSSLQMVSKAEASHRVSDGGASRARARAEVDVPRIDVVTRHSRARPARPPVRWAMGGGGWSSALRASSWCPRRRGRRACPPRESALQCGPVAVLALRSRSRGLPPQLGVRRPPSAAAQQRLAPSRKGTGARWSERDGRKEGRKQM